MAASRWTGANTAERGPTAVREGGVQHGHLVAEYTAHARDGLGRQRDLGDEENGPVTGRYDAPQHIEVHQGLAGAGDALDQHGCLGRRGEDSRYHATLVGRQLRGRGRREPGERIAWA